MPLGMIGLGRMGAFMAQRLIVIRPVVAEAKGQIARTHGSVHN